MGRRGSGVNLSVVRTIGFLLVVIGFFMPVTNVIFGRGPTGFSIASGLMDSNRVLMGLLMYAVFATAVIGLVIGTLMMMSRRTKISPNLIWVVLVVCIASGLIVYFSSLGSPALLTGGILILIGWIVALVGQLLARR